MLKKTAALVIAILCLAGTNCLAAEKVGALGRIRPGDGIVQIVFSKGDTIAAIYVKEGDIVEKKAPLVLMSSKAAYEQNVKMAKSDLDATDRMGAMAITQQRLKAEETEKKGLAAIAIQKLNIRKAEINYGFATSRMESLENIGGESFSKQQVLHRKYELDSAQINLALSRKEMERLKLDLEIGLSAAKNELDRLIQQRDIDVSKARTRLELAETDVSTATLQAPSAGTILEILRHPGDKTAGEPILTMADLSKMAVIAEVFESDILKLAPGMKATITSKALPSELTGKVVSIGRIVSENSKIVKVKILLDSAETARKLINLEVDVSIEL